MQSEEEIREVKRRHSAELLGQPGVCGVGVEKDAAGNFVLAVHLSADDAEVRKRLPSEIEGYRIKFVVSGPFEKLAGT